MTIKTIQAIKKQINDLFEEMSSVLSSTTEKVNASYYISNDEIQIKLKGDNFEYEIIERNFNALEKRVLSFFDLERNTTTMKFKKRGE